ncbi:MAG: hypothetical protein OXU51_19880 [Candidatus Poribacteria bacterium]|nr:hypothetical protein [Candidatus Poribacteria bacterium]
MRLFTVIVISFIVLIAAGSFYVHLDTKQFVGNLTKPPQIETTKRVFNDAPPIEKSHRNSGSRSLDTTPLTTEKKVVGTPDWREDTEHHKQLHKHPSDPWAQNVLTDKENESQNFPQEAALNPHDPTFSEVRRQRLIEEFGDIPEVHMYVDGFLNRDPAPMSLTDIIAHVEAASKLFPNSSQTRRTLKVLYAIRSGDMETAVKYAEPSKVTQSVESPFAGVEDYFKKGDAAEGFRRLRAANPDRAVQLEQDLMKITANRPEIRKNFMQALKNSYKPQGADAE